MSYGRKFASLFCVAIALVAPRCVTASAAPAGAIAISVDATQVPQRILHAKLVFPVHPGPLTLYYPKWMPADHSPDGPVWNLAGLKFFSGTQEIPWQQDDVDMYAFNLNVPAGTNSIDAALDFLISAPGPTIDFSASGAANLFILMWNQVLLYPKGWPAADLIFHPTLTLPGQWKFSTSLAGQQPIRQHNLILACPTRSAGRFARAVGGVHADFPSQCKRQPSPGIGCAL